MRDIVLTAIVLPWAMFALKHPWIGVLLWVWVSLMNPHRYTWGFASTAPIAMLAGVVTLIGFLGSREKSSPFKGPPVVWLTLLVCWITLSWLFGMDRAGQYEQWDKVMKVYLMVFVTLMVVRTKLQIMLLVWVMTLSIALLSVKGGAFTIMHGGSYRVWGPPGSWIEGNNDFAVATIMTIPLLRFMQLQVTRVWLSRTLMVMMLLCAASALGSQSRGAFLAIVTMTAVLWWRGQNKLRNGVVLLVLGVGMVAAMPDTWTERMETIQSYETDESSIGRLSAWWTAWGIAKNNVFGVGFNATYRELFEAYSPYWPNTGTPAAHSIWFQMMGHHGFIGFLLFLALWVSTWRLATKLRHTGHAGDDLKWVRDLGAMCQVCVVGYGAGGAFLQLAYYDFPYYVMAVVALTYAWVRRGAWKVDRPEPGKWLGLIGIASQPAPDPKSSKPQPATGAGANQRPGTPASKPAFMHSLTKR